MSILITGGSFETRLAEAKKRCPEGLVFDVAKIEEIRELQRVVATGQSVIISNAQNLSEEAATALLKTLEEGSGNIILLAQNEDQLLPTVVSRCFIEKINDNFLIKKINNIEDIRTREEALDYIDGLLMKCHAELVSASPSHSREIPGQARNDTRKLLQAKKYLKANTNVRLTLENLPLN